MRNDSIAIFSKKLGISLAWVVFLFFLFFVNGKAAEKDMKKHNLFFTRDAMELFFNEERGGRVSIFSRQLLAFVRFLIYKLFFFFLKKNLIGGTAPGCGVVESFFTR